METHNHSHSFTTECNIHSQSLTITHKHTHSPALTRTHTHSHALTCTHTHSHALNLLSQTLGTTLTLTTTFSFLVSQTHSGDTVILAFSRTECNIHSHTLSQSKCRVHSLTHTHLLASHKHRLDIVLTFTHSHSLPNRVEEGHTHPHSRTHRVENTLTLTYLLSL